MSIPHASGALYSTIKDLYQWDQALYTDQLLPQAQLAETFVPRAVVSDSEGQAYGYDWLIGEGGSFSRGS